MKKIAVLGARGMIGRALMNILNEYDQKFQVRCFGTSENSQIHYKGINIDVEMIENFVASDFDVIFSMLGSDATMLIKDEIEKSQAIWIDKSSALRMEAHVPLIVPEVNADQINGANVISSPNCVVIPVVMFLNLIEDLGITDIILSTYQSVSGAGIKAMNALFREAKESLFKPSKVGLYYSEPMIYNVIPNIGTIEEEGENAFLCDEEIKIKQEIRKILKSNFSIAVTSVRVPVVIGHMISLTFTLKKQIKLEQLERRLNQSSIVYSRKPMTPVTIASEDEVFACRLRENGVVSGGYSYSIILLCDNIRKGGALNAFQIARTIGCI